MELGIKLIVQLAFGLIKAIPQLVAAIPQIITALVGGLGKVVESVGQIGQNIVKGLWDGICSMINWLKDKIADFVGGIVGGIKGFLGIKSPSRVFAGIGQNMGEGLGVGFQEVMAEVQKDMQDAIPTDFNTDLNLKTDIGREIDVEGARTSQATGVSGLNVYIENFINNRAQDVEAFARELEFYSRRGALSQG